MKTIKIAVCDDDLLFAQQAANAVKSILQDNHIEYSISIFLTGNGLLHADFFDVVFLDIEMNGQSGIETAEALRKMENNCRIIFLTSHEKYVFSAFDVDASHYMLKPLDKDKLDKVLMKIVNQLTKASAYCYTVKTGAQVYRVPFSQIKYAEVFGRKITIHTSKEIVTFNGKLEELEKNLPSGFFRCHKSYIINLAMVIKYDKETAMLKSGDRVPIARRKSSEFGTAFLNFLQEEGDI